jgi:hypothetical protein
LGWGWFFVAGVFGVVARSQSRVCLNVLALYASAAALLRALLENFLSSLFMMIFEL